MRPTPPAINHWRTGSFGADRRDLSSSGAGPDLPGSALTPSPQPSFYWTRQTSNRMSSFRSRRSPGELPKRLTVELLETMLDAPSPEHVKDMLLHIFLDIHATRDPEPWVAAACALEARGRISRNAVLYFMDKFLDCVTEEGLEHDPELIRIEDAIDRVERAHGVSKDRPWKTHEGTTEWQALNVAWDARLDVLRADRVRAMGFGDLADDMERDAEESGRRATLGRAELRHVAPE